MQSLLLRRRHRNFLKLWVAQLISQFGDRIHQLALVGLIAERDPGSVTGLAKLLAFTILPVFVVQPLAGVFVDRWDRRTTLFICDVIRGFLVLLIPLAFMFRESMVPIYAIVFLVFCFSRFYIPAKLSIIPQIVPKSKLLPANSLMTVTGMIAFVFGCALGGFLIDRFGARNGFLIDAATYFLSASLLLSMRLRKRLKEVRQHVADVSKHLVGKVKSSVWGELKDGFLFLFKNADIRFIINIFFFLFAGAGAVYVVIIVFIQKAFGSITQDLGVIAVFLGAGLFVGALLYGKFGKHVVWYKTIIVCVMAAGGGIVLFALLVGHFASLGLACVLAFALGAILGPVFIASNTIVHVVSEESMRGKVFAALEIIIHAAFLLAMLASSWLSHQLGEQWVLIATGGLLICLGIAARLSDSKLKNLAMK
jgi:MFS family permease